MTTLLHQHSHANNRPSSSFALQCFAALAVTVSALVQPVITAILLLSAWLYQSCRSHRRPEPQVHVHQRPSWSWTDFFPRWTTNHRPSHCNPLDHRYSHSHQSHTNTVHVSSYHSQPTGLHYRSETLR